jgi:hypothetical protein
MLISGAKNLKGEPIMDKIKQYLKREMRHYKRQMRRCKKQYPDWRDDEYNMLDNLFVWAVTENPEDQHSPSFSTLNKAEIYYNRATERYYMHIDTEHYDLTRADARESYAFLLHDIKNKLRDHLTALNGNMTIDYKKFNIADIMDYGLDGESLEEIYSKFSLLVMGVDKYYT